MDLETRMMDIETVGVLGYGEVGKAFTSHFNERGYEVIVTNRSPDQLRARIDDREITVAGSSAELATSSDLLFSCVWPETALSVAKNCSSGLEDGNVYLDVNSIAPSTARQIETTVTEAGSSFLNGGLLDSINQYGTDVSLALGGRNHVDMATFLEDEGFTVQDLGSDPERPAVLKLSRSVVMKGVLALFVEALLPALKYDLTEEVLESVDESFERQTMAEFIRFLLVDTTSNAERRAGELTEINSMMENMDYQSEVVEQSLWLNRTVHAEDIEGDEYNEVLKALESLLSRSPSSPRQ